MNNSWQASLIRLAFLTLAGVLSVAVHLLMANAVHGLWNHLQGEEYFFSIWNYSCTVIYHPFPSLTLLASELFLALWGAREAGRSGTGLLRESVPVALALVPLWYTMIFVGVFVIEAMSYRIAFLVPSLLSDGLYLSNAVFGIWWPISLLLAVAGVLIPYRALASLHRTHGSDWSEESGRIPLLLQKPLAALLIAGVAGWMGWRALDILSWMV